MTYVASPTRRRRTKGEMVKLRETIYAVIEADHPMTVRQVFYRLVSMGMIEKTETEYNRTVGRLLMEMRLDYDLPFEWIADNSRWMRKPRSHSSLKDMLEITTDAYRRALWPDQDAYVEIWLEKEALAGVFYLITAQWDVPLMVTRGYPSISFLYEAAEEILDQDNDVHLYYFGDYDPSGVHIPQNIRQRLEEFGAHFEFTRVAITPEIIEDYDLPTRPTKRSDTRARSFTGESVELDALPPAVLREMVENCIIEHVDGEALEKTQIAERSERELLSRWDEILDNFSSGQPGPAS